jgi:diguanylate cyclase (GGDEF)-like protein
MSIHLRTIVTGLFAIMLTILTILLGAIFTNQAGEEVRSEVGESLEGQAFQLADKLGLFMSNRYNEVQLVSGLPAFREQNLSEGKELIEELKVKFPSFSWIGLTDDTGTVISSSDDILLGESIAERPVYVNALESPFIGDVHDAILLSKLLPNPSGEPLQFVDISVPLTDEKGEFIGVFATHLSWKWAEEVEQTLQKPNHSLDKTEVLIVSNQDHTVLLGPDYLVGQQLEKSLFDTLTATTISENVVEWDGKNYVTGYAAEAGYGDYKGLGWHVIVRQPEEVAYSGVNDLVQFMWIISGIAIFVFALIGWAIAEQIAKPLRIITKAAKEIGQGTQRDMPVVTGIKDVQDLSVSIRNMVETITTTQSQLIHMESLAHQDTLTNLPNRVALYEKMEATITGTEQTWMILFMDLDGFKAVNDLYSHKAGDHVLIVVASRLKHFATDDQFVARLGGDEFVFLTRINEHDIESMGRACIDEIISLIQEPIAINDVTVQVGCSIGAAIYPIDSNHPIEAMHLADEALYTSKQQGKGIGTFYKK